MQPVPPLVITKVGGAARLLGDAALVTDTKLRTILGELDSGEINNKSSISLCLYNLVCESCGLKHTGRQKQMLQLARKRYTSF